MNSSKKLGETRKLGAESSGRTELEASIQDEASLAPRKYWDSLWQSGSLPCAVNPRDRSLLRHIDLRFDGLFRDVFLPQERSDRMLQIVEVGCARSAWLPYFAKEFGLRVTGIDYSAIGCDQARSVLAKEGIDGEIISADIMHPPDRLLRQFDYLVSFGVAEHFEATDQCLRACASFLRAGGKMVTIIPNMKGLVGSLQKLLDREVYDVHVPLDSALLRLAHETAGLKISRCEYFCFLNAGVLNLNRIRQTFFGLLFSQVLNAISVATWMIERTGIRLPANRITSPYIVCVSTKAL